MMNETHIPKTMQEAVKMFADELFCVHFVANLRWPDDKAYCPKCGDANNTFIEKRRVWQCKTKECNRKQFSVKQGTIFEDSAIGLDKWLVAMWLLVNAKNGISSYELHRALGITQKSAWFVLHRIREAMANGTIEKLTGTVEVDESYVGGNAKFMHSKRRKEKNVTTGGHGHKTVVMGLVQRQGKVRAKVIRTNTKEILMSEIVSNIEAGSTVMTDQLQAYKSVRHEYVHEVINHSHEYVRDNIHTNNIENFWSLLKRAIKGTYISVSPEHLQKYVEEQMFRYNNREGNDQMRFVSLLELISGKRLTYSQLIGYETGH